MTRALSRRCLARRVLLTALALVFTVSLAAPGWAVNGNGNGNGHNKGGAPPVVEEPVPEAPDPVVEEPPVVAPTPPVTADPDAPLASAPTVLRVKRMAASAETPPRTVQARKRGPAPGTPGTPAASSVAPTYVDGNPVLASPGIRIESLPGDGESRSYPPGHIDDSKGIVFPVVVTITVHDTENGPTIDWTSTWPVKTVTVKGGPCANVYGYAGSMGDSGLHAPVNSHNGIFYGLSHVDFEFLEPGSIDVTKFGDTDGDGVFDESESVLQGWTFKLYLGDTLVDSKTTGADGTVHFDGIAPASYTIEEVAQDGWKITTWGIDGHFESAPPVPSSIPVLLESGDTDSVVAGNALVSDLLVMKFHDVDKDGVRDAGEPTLADFDFALERGGTTRYTATSDASGAALFSGVLPGDYLLHEVVNGDWYATTVMPMAITLGGGQDQLVEVGNTYDITKTFELTYPDLPTGAVVSVTYWIDGGQPGSLALSGADGVYTGTVPVRYGGSISGQWMVTSGQIVEQLAAFGPEVLTGPLTNRLTYDPAVSGLKYRDSDGDGTRDEGEPGIAGWGITLERLTAEEPAPTAVGASLGAAAFAPYATVLTAADGSFAFNGLPPGTYRVSEESRAGFVQTEAPADPTFAVTAATAIDDLVFGNAPLAGITVLKYNDLDGSGARDDGEPALAGWTFTATKGDSVRTGETGEDGTVTFAGLEPGVWTVDEVARDGWTATRALPVVVTMAGEDVTVLVGNTEGLLPFTEVLVDKSADKSTAKPGDTVTYTLRYKNTGGGTVNEVTLVDDYDQRYATPTDLAGGSDDGDSITWVDSDPIGPGEARTIVYTMRIASSMPTGTTNVDNVVVLSPGGDRADWRVRVSEGEGFLPFTGGEWAALALAALLAFGVGIALRMYGKVVPH